MQDVQRHARYSKTFKSTTVIDCVVTFTASEKMRAMLSHESTGATGDPLVDAQLLLSEAINRNEANREEWGL